MGEQSLESSVRWMGGNGGDGSRWWEVGDLAWRRAAGGAS